MAVYFERDSATQDSVYTGLVDGCRGATGMTVFIDFTTRSTTYLGRLCSTWGATQSQIQWDLEVSDNNTILFVMCSGPSGSSVYYSRKTTDAGLVNNTRYRLMVTWEGVGANTVTFSLNGTTLTTTTGPFNNNQTNIQDVQANLQIGSEVDSLTECMSADRAEVAVWNTEVGTQAERNAFTGSDMSPLLMEPASLVNYVPLHNLDAPRDLIEGVTLTQQGTNIANAAHPPVIMPSAQILQFPTAPVVANAALLTHPHRHTNLGFG